MWNWFWRLRCTALVQLPQYSKPGKPELPLFFHHIPKSGGTTTIAAIKSITPLGMSWREPGNRNISAQFVQRLADRELRFRDFIYGHPEMAAVTPLLGRARIVTIVRDPLQHAVSNYLWIRNDPTTPHHALAQQLNFADFLTAHPYYLAFQGASLLLGLGHKSADGIHNPHKYLPIVLKYLAEMHLVGTTRGLDLFIARLAAELGFPKVTKAKYLRRGTSMPDELKARYSQRYADLRRDRRLGNLIDAEYEVYKKAQSLEKAANAVEEPTCDALPRP